jgi:hypothetical protein
MIDALAAIMAGAGRFGAATATDLSKSFGPDLF